MSVFSKLIKDLKSLKKISIKKKNNKEKFSFLKLFGYEGNIDKLMPFKYFERKGYIIKTICLECPEPIYKNERYQVIFSYTLNDKLLLIIRDAEKGITYLTFVRL